MKVEKTIVARPGVLRHFDHSALFRRNNDWEFVVDVSDRHVDGGNGREATSIEGLHVNRVDSLKHSFPPRFLQHLRCP